MDGRRDGPQRRRLRVLVVCDFLFKYGSQQARALKRAGNDVAMLCRSHALEFGGSERERHEVLAALDKDSVELFVLPGRVRSVAAIPALAQIRRRLRRWQPDVVHVHENHDPRLLALTTGFRTVFTVHDPVEHLGARAFTRAEEWIFDQWFARAERLVVHGGTLADELARIVGPERVIVIPHGTWPHPEPFPPPTSPGVLLFGRLERYKGVEVLAEAMPVIWAQRPEVRLIVAGSGPAAAFVPIDPRVRLLDRYIPERDVEPLLAQASLVVLPYTQASQSGVGMLAVAAGVPVIVSDLGALPELALDPSFVAPAGNPAALAAAILRHLDDGVAVRQRLLRHTEARYSWRHVAQMTTELYTEMLARPPLSSARGRRRSSGGGGRL